MQRKKIGIGVVIGEMLFCGCVEVTPGDDGDIGDGDRSTDPDPSDTNGSETYSDRIATATEPDRLYVGPCKSETRYHTGSDYGERDDWYIYDEEGRLTRQEIFYGGEVLEAQEIEDYIYNTTDDGFEKTVRSGTMTQMEVVYRRTYTEGGALAAYLTARDLEVPWSESEAWDDWDNEEFWEYDDAGNLLTVGDPTSVFERYINTYDDEGRIVSIERDIGDNGTIEDRRELTYDDAGNLVLETYAIEEDSGSGTVEYTYDADGRLSTSTDTFGSTETERLVTYAYTYDVGGALTVEMESSEVSYPQSIEAARTDRYNAAGIMIFSENRRVTNQIQKQQSSHTFREWDDEGRMLYSRALYNNNESWNALSAYHYDEFGNLMKLNECENFDPSCLETGYLTCCGDTAGMVTEYFYECR